MRTVATAFISLLVGLAGGVLLTFPLAEANLAIDFCNDQTSGRYIWDDESRINACEGKSPFPNSR